MASFSTEAEIAITVPSAELTSARREIENELSAVEVGVSSGGTASRVAQTDGGSPTSGGRRSRRMFRWARQRTGFMEEAVELLESIDDKVGDSGGGGGLLGTLGIAGLGARVGGAVGGGALGGVTASSLITGTVTASALITGSVAAGALIVGTVATDSLIGGTLSAASVIVGTVAAGSLVVGTVAAGALIVGTVATGSLIVGTVSAGTLIAGTIAAGSLVAGTIAAGSIIAGTVGLQELIDISRGGDGIEPVREAGQDFAESNPEIADFIHTGMTNNPIHDAGQRFGSFIRGEGPQSPSEVRGIPQDGTTGPQEGTQVNIDGINADVSVEGTQFDRDVDIEREARRVTEEELRNFERRLERKFDRNTGGSGRRTP